MVSWMDNRSRDVSLLKNHRRRETIAEGHEERGWRSRLQLWCQGSCPHCIDDVPLTPCWWSAMIS